MTFMFLRIESHRAIENTSLRVGMRDSFAQKPDLLLETDRLSVNNLLNTLNVTDCMRGFCPELTIVDSRANFHRAARRRSEQR
ncbi:unnamed protein product [Taenia asiatica]|uniref:Response regulator n=1 Tax=Taenia asiatica TaxID=60517 RepID=A0A0R3WED6_TAEAS|nr:unnamed protein product [Taenia asiatica]